MLHLRLLLLSIFCFSFLGSHAQFTEDFSDGELSSNPVWSGDTALFQVNAQFQLQSDGLSQSDTIAITTPSTVIDSAEWEIWMRLKFGPSTGNNPRIYLVSNTDNLLTGNPQGYFLDVGETGSLDKLRLVRQDGAAYNDTTWIASSSSPCFTSSSDNIARIKVKRDILGNWEVLSDCGGGSNFSQIMTATDLTYTSTQYFGILCRHTTTRDTLFYFDDIYAGGWRFDTTPPAVVNISPVPDSMVRVEFSEDVDPLSAQDVNNYSLTTFLNPSSATLTANPKIVELNFHPDNFVNGVTYTLTVTGVSDLLLNTMTVPGVDSFTYLLPTTALFKEVIINEVLPDTELTATSMPREFVELYNTTGQYFNLKDWQFGDRGAPKVLDSLILGPNEYLILCKASDAGLFQGFGRVLPLSSWPSLNNSDENLYLYNQNGMLIDSLYYNSVGDINWHDIPAQEDGGWSLELVDPLDDCSYTGNWRTSVDASGGTPGRQNSVYFPGMDSLGPTLETVNVTGPSSIRLCFNESMDLNSLQTANYITSPSLTVQSIVPDGPQFMCVDITFTDTIELGRFYTLSVNGVMDCKNQPGGGQGQFVLGGNALPFEVVITEIFTDYTMPAGDPPTQLANVEDDFIEIHNLSTKAISLNGWTLDDDPFGTAGSLEDYTLLPNSYLILCKDKTAWSGFGNAIEVASWQDLGATTDSLELRDANGNLIDFVYYSDDWYKDPNKDDGGWSMEKVDPSYICMDSSNWRASLNPAGGTPANANSQNVPFVDQTPPGLVRAAALDPLTIRVWFDEILDPSTATTPSNYEINPGGIVPMMVVLPTNIPTYVATYVDLVLPIGLDTNVAYCLKARFVADCPGNVVDSTDEVCFGIPLPADSGDLILNEILFDQYTGGSDYVELYNNSDKIIDLSTVYIANDDFPNGKKVTDETILVLPATYICLTENKAFQISTYLPIDPDAIYEVKDLPTFDNSDGECVVYTDTNTILDRFLYDAKMQFPNLDSKDGVSLERLAFDAPTQDANNWHSAASTANYGTPGYQNSEILIPNPQEGRVWLVPEVFSPDQDGYDDHLTIHYEFQTIGNNVRVAAFDSRGRLVKVIKENTLIANNQVTNDTTIAGFFKWDGTTEAGHKAPVGIYAILFEVSNPNTGKTETFKLAAVLAAILPN